MFSSDPTYPAFSILSFIAFILVLVPLPWHLQAWNSGTCLFMIWTAIGCLNLFINSIIWHNNVTDWAPVWCDISTRLMVGLSVAIPASALCIHRRLYNIAACTSVSVSRAEKKRSAIIDLAIGLGIPLLQMPLQFIVQGHRYDIYEDIGCYPTTVNTPPAYVLTFLWPNIIGLVSAVYCIMTLREFMKRRAQFSQFVSSHNSLTMSRYFRLMSLATIELVTNMPIVTFGLVLTITSQPIYPWISWDDIHYDFNIIDVFPAALWRQSPSATATLELSRWSMVFCGLMFFAFFGFADEARKNYSKAFWAVMKLFGISPPPVAPFHKGSKSFGRAPPKVPFASKASDSYPSTTNSSSTFTISYPSTTSIDKPVGAMDSPPDYKSFKLDGSMFKATPTSDHTRTPTTTAPSDALTPCSNSRFSTAWSAHNSITTLFRETDGIHYGLKPYGMKYPKAIGSYSDLSFVDPSSPLSPSTTVASLSTDGTQKGSSNTPPSPPAPLSPPPPNPRRLRPLFLANHDRGRGAFANGMKSPTSSRPLSYPSYSPSQLRVNPPLPIPSNPPVPLPNH